MSAQPGQSNGCHARRIIGAGGVMGASPDFGLAPLAVAPPARADVINHFIGDRDAFGVVGSRAFEPRSGTTEARFGGAKGALQTAVAGPDCFAGINTDRPLSCQAWRDMPGLIAGSGNAGWLAAITDLAARLAGWGLIGDGLDGLADGNGGNGGKGRRGELIKPTGLVGQ